MANALPAKMGDKDKQIKPWLDFFLSADPLDVWQERNGQRTCSAFFEGVTNWLKWWSQVKSSWAKFERQGPFHFWSIESRLLSMQSSQRTSLGRHTQGSLESITSKKSWCALIAQQGLEHCPMALSCKGRFKKNLRPSQASSKILSILLSGSAATTTIEFSNR
jgi:hypothetical protein